MNKIISGDDLLDAKFTRCRLGADWCVQAWSLTDTKFIVDDELDEEATFVIVKRTLLSDESYAFVELAGPITAQEAVIEGLRHKERVR